ncbi:Glutathione S-transferase, domain-containing protein [Cladophialophora immunda]|nr:Glutathione S-transferase, domain-containing protein [Cladophialophora immunda]
MTTSKAVYTLYHNHGSICSRMVRYTFALRGPPKDDSCDIALEEKSIDIFNEEQLSEHFLCEINPHGQVPVLASPVLEKTIPDSLQITHHIARLYPSLIPDSHADQIRSLLSDLHSLNYFSLSFSGREHVAHGFKTAVQQRLDGDISGRYRAALTFKLGV